MTVEHHHHDDTLFEMADMGGSSAQAGREWDVVQHLFNDHGCRDLPEAHLVPRYWDAIVAIHLKHHPERAD